MPVRVMTSCEGLKELIQQERFVDMKETMADSNDIGMNTFDQALYELFQNGQITKESALLNADSRNDLSLKIRFESERQTDGFGS